MTHKTAYIWGPVTSFNGAIAAALVMKGWHVHFASKSSLNILSLSPLDLTTQARSLLDLALGGKEKARAFQDRLKVVEGPENKKSPEGKNQKYDAIIFSALPPNFDEARGARAPWTGGDLKALTRSHKDTPIFIVSSLWGGIQKDGVVPEELEFGRRKPQSQWENTCQQYEQRLLESLSGSESVWYMVRLPMLSGDTKDGSTSRIAGIYSLLRELKEQNSKPLKGKGPLKLAYNPDSTLWFLPIDHAVNTFLRLLEDESRPRICNLVSTQASLNREWLSHLATVLQAEEIEAKDPDDLNLPSTLRKMLIDDVQVKTRNLFEVSGRYQLLPVVADKDYLSKLIDYAESMHWGEPQSQPQETTVDYSEKVARFYFEEFVPEKLAQGALKHAKINGHKIGFKLRASSFPGWMLKVKPNSENEAMLTVIDPAFDRPDVCFHFSGMTLAGLIQKKIHLSRALLMKEVTVEGNMLQVFKIAGLIEKFLKDFPLSKEDLAKSQVD
ncbi:MAG: SCP2 sterol-binding domain-containing protein [Candidatus Melainabacteria bacterium]|nr:SCP2 sterol-binding domain-containing protein [Candidatus Melainabacteria bacterium]